MKIGFLGTGGIAAPMVEALSGKGHHILVSERSAEVSARLAAQFAEVEIAPNDRVVAASEVVIACLMADVARAVLPDLPFREGQKLISVMVDVSVNSLRELAAPVTDISVTIPMPFIGQGGCPLPVYPDTGSVAALFGAENIVLPVTSEAALNAHFAASALSSVVLAEMVTTADWLADITGDAAKAEAYVAALIAGYFKNMRFDGSGEVKALLDALSTEGGLNATLRDRMAGARKELTEGLDAFRPRLGLPDA
ncbi:NAD(P)-binding domain-containing protein [uncultured Roseovarius sp.]|uniref:NAD(P)-binding domain-containing protein n=1 Tax=uncultured Roseovarius sp. TaxID=293344 RepID=UPI0025F4AA89|nr:NAD(P)-binding domain-containing protein [uncultured Roseovarius sp.]